MGLDSLGYTRARADACLPALAFPGGGAEAVRRWQEQLRPRLAALLGGLPGPGPLAAEVLERSACPGYTREALLFDTRPDLRACAWLLVPDAAPSPMPCVICLPGHGVGANDIVGLDAEGRPRSEGCGYQRDFALAWVRRGFAVLVLEPLGFGRRRDAHARAAGPEVTSCEPAAGAALLLGETLLGWRVGDVVRAVDYLETRPEVDATRIGICGISGGATAALFAAALEPRLRAALVSGYLGRFRDSIAAVPHCICNYVPGIARLCELPDVAGLVAPRALFAEHGERDEVFPVDAARSAFDALRPIWAALGAAERVGLELFPGGHEFWGREGLPFVARALGE